MILCIYPQNNPLSIKSEKFQNVFTDFICTASATKDKQFLETFCDKTYYKKLKKIPTLQGLQQEMPTKKQLQFYIYEENIEKVKKSQQQCK